MKKFLSMVLALTILFATLGQAPAGAKTVTPKVKFVTQPKAEYKDGDRISFVVTAPNYSGKVEYRVMLWNGTTKKTSELWSKQPGYYYKNWQPKGTQQFTINWPVKGMEPGAYSLTVLVRPAGSKIPYASSVKTNTVWVRPQVEIDPKFIGDGTEKRVHIVKANVGKLYDDIYGWKNTKLLYIKDSSTYMMKDTKPIYEGSTDATIHDNLIYLSQFKNYPYISYNGKEYAMLLGSSLNIKQNVELEIKCLKGIDWFNNSKDSDRDVLDGKPHNFEVYTYEVFYDTQINEYYLANESHEHWKGAIAKEVEQKVGEMPKFVAVPLQVADF